MFDDVRLPEDVEIGAHGGPLFQTTIVALASGGEQRNQDWSEQRCEFDIGYGIQHLEDFEAVQSFFYGRRGRARGFRFKDWSDYQITDELIGTGDNTTTAFQIIKTYSDTAHSYGRRITRPVASTVVVKVDDVLQTVTTDYTLAASTGIITFTSAPALDAEITVTAEFDVPCRFDTDKFDLSIDGFQAGVLQSLAIVELRE